jgi:hypothetical protein
LRGQKRFTILPVPQNWGPWVLGRNAPLLIRPRNAMIIVILTLKAIGEDSRCVFLAE